MAPESAIEHLWLQHDLDVEATKEVNFDRSVDCRVPLVQVRITNVPRCLRTPPEADGLGNKFA
jgi:hypothetical protein